MMSTERILGVFYSMFALVCTSVPTALFGIKLTNLEKSWYVFSFILNCGFVCFFCIKRESYKILDNLDLAFCSLFGFLTFFAAFHFMEECNFLAFMYFVFAHNFGIV